MKVSVYDPWADPEEVQREYGMKSYQHLADLPHKEYEAVVLAVAHQKFLDLNLNKLKCENGVVYDVKGVLDKDRVEGRL